MLSNKILLLKNIRVRMSVLSLITGQAVSCLWQYEWDKLLNGHKWLNLPIFLKFEHNAHKFNFSWNYNFEIEFFLFGSC